jgi:Fur family iron response transcriptional regulator|tara:strand:- start:1336 stop:1758 length:423 start_codon:yes stop_codon:yes gene_type:complete
MTNSVEFIEKLRNSGLRPTKQRIKICEALFKSHKTFHFTIKDLSKILENKTSEKISLATLYNTVSAFLKKGYLKEISINSNKSYYDTNVDHHHHFFDEDNNELIDINDKDVEPVKIKANIPGKKINSIEVLVKVSTDHQS